MSFSSSDSSSRSASSEIPWGQSSRSAARLRDQQLMFQVLDNPSLREEILKHVIIGEGKKVDHQTVCTLRRVDKSWNESVLRILWKLHEPLNRVFPGDGGTLEAFAKTFSRSCAISASPPPLKLDRFSPQFEGTEDLERFSNFMTSCGPALDQLGLEISDHWDPLPVDLPLRWSLPRLHKLELFCALGAVAAADEQPEAEVPVQQKISDCLIKTTLLGATALAELYVSLIEWSSVDPDDVTMFESIILPPTVVRVKLEIALNLQLSKDAVNALLRNPLPNVTSFTFIVWRNAFAEGMLFSIMDTWKRSLTNLMIVGRDYEGPPRNVTTFRFPVMEQLEEFSISSVTVELESGLGSLERFLPKLRSLRLRLQSPGMLRMWTESSRFSGVTSLELLLADGNFNPQANLDDFPVNVNMEAMQAVNSAFPNLRKLGLAIPISDPSGLRYVFQEMRQLVTLKLKVFGEISEGTSQVWDSVLTGVSAEMMASIRGSEPGSLENAEGLIAITNLKELKSLSLENDLCLSKRGYDLGGQSSLISDFTFHHAFLKMPQLSHLHFEGPFKVSEEMTNKWIGGEEDRSLFYQLVSDSDFDIN